MKTLEGDTVVVIRPAAKKVFLALAESTPGLVRTMISLAAAQLERLGYSIENVERGADG